MSSLDAFVRKSAWFSFIIVVNVDIVVIWKKNKEKIQNWNLTTFYLYILLFLQWKLTFDQQLSLPSETINHANAGRVVSDGGVSYIARWDAWKYFFTIFFPIILVLPKVLYLWSGVICKIHFWYLRDGKETPKQTSKMCVGERKLWFCLGFPP